MNKPLKIALVSPPQKTRYPQPPMGLATIAGILERSGHRSQVVDANALQLTPENVAQHVGDADVVGLTAMTPTINAALKIARHLKKLKPGRTIILGGAHATLLPEDTLRSTPEVDLITVGEADSTILDVLKAIQDGSDFRGIQGIAYRQNGQVVTATPRDDYTELDSLPFMAYHLLPLEKSRPHPPHGRALPFAAIITSRGCPYRCSYCSKPVFGRKFRVQSPERVIEEITYLKKKFGFREFAFYDDVFTLDKKRAFGYAEGLLSKGVKIHWTCETRVNLVDRDLLRMMKKSGCYAISYGIESGAPEIRHIVHKDISQDEIEEAVRISREEGLHTIGYFMIGSPGETPQTIQTTIDFAARLRLDYAQFAITTPFPGTELYDIYLKKGGKQVSWDNFVYEASGDQAPPVFESEDLSRADLQCWAKKAYRHFYLRPSYVWQRIRQTTSVGDLRINVGGFMMLLRK